MWNFGDFGEIQHLSWIRGPKTSKYCKYYVCFPHVAPRARPFSENIGFQAKKLELSQKLHILRKLLISTKFQEISPQGYFFAGPVKYPLEPYIIVVVSCPFSKTPADAGADFHEKEHFVAQITKFW